MSQRRLRLRLRGTVQGVGMRPFAFGLASRLELSGFVRNDAQGVLIEVEGARVGAFIGSLKESPPPLARIESIEVADLAPLGAQGFTIETTNQGSPATNVAADTAVCEACLAELFDPKSRFFGYPFVNCTHCGPRYTLTYALPYDRGQTSMAAFPMCEACARDYADPSNRRFHAEPIACPSCGPRLNVEIGDIASSLREGGIVALKGLGGFHLMCDAHDDAAVARVRLLKARDSRPFAVMVANAASTERFADLSPAERALLEHPARPIVLAPSRGHVAPSVAPSLRDVGLMLAYTPLHWLVFHALAGAPDFRFWSCAPSDLALVVTSANRGGEPLIASNDHARERLNGVDLVVTHDRTIVVRADDTVSRVLDGAPAYIRRARGFAPDPIDLGEEGPCVVAAGADHKNTVTITRGREAFVSQHIGDLDDRQTIRFRDETIRHLTSILAVKPDFAACDLHPDFISARSAEATGLPVVAVQHHVAHIAAVAAERHWAGPVLGVALDGQGYGADGAPWGGELIELDGTRWRRVGSLEPLALLGADRAAREPWRMGVAMLHRLGRLDEAGERFGAAPGAASLAKALARGVRFPMTSSLGRLFDAAAALAGVCVRQRYEGQAAMELEALVQTPRVIAQGWRIVDGRLDLAPLIETMLSEKLIHRDFAEGFHGTLIEALVDWIGVEAASRGLVRVALGGGCLMNRVLAEGLCARLRELGLDPALPRAVPANDGGVSFGQAAFALAWARGHDSEMEA